MWVRSRERRLAVAAFEVERVHRVPRGVVRRDPESFEVVVLEFDLGSLDHVEPHRSEGGHDGALRPRDGMKSAGRKRAPGKTHVERCQILCPTGLHFGLFHLQGLTEAGLRIVQQPTDGGPAGGIETSEDAKRKNESRLSSEVLGSPYLNVPLLVEAE